MLYQKNNYHLIIKKKTANLIYKKTKLKRNACESEFPAVTHTHTFKEKQRQIKINGSHSIPFCEGRFAEEPSVCFFFPRAKKQHFLVLLLLFVDQIIVIDRRRRRRRRKRCIAILKNKQ